MHSVPTPPPIGIAHEVSVVVCYLEIIHRLVPARMLDLVYLYPAIVSPQPVARPAGVPER